MFTPLLVSSCYSLHYGTVFPRDLVQRACKLGYQALALTDRNGVYGIPSFLDAGVEVNRNQGTEPETGTKQERGTELKSPMTTEQSNLERFSAILGTELVEGDIRALLIARTRAGWARICRILTDQASGRFDLGRTILQELELCPCVLDHGSVPDLFIATDNKNLLESARGRAYALLAPMSGRSGSGAFASWKRLGETGALPLATGEVRFLHPSDREVQRLLIAIGSGRTKYDVPDTELAAPDSVLQPPHDAARLYDNVPEAILSNEALVESIELHSIFDGYVFPKYKAGNGDRASTELRALVYQGAKRRYGAIDEITRSRLEYELEIIESKGFSDYFLIVRDIVRKSARTCGRGSAAASVVSYALGITDIDPIAHGLYFERFLNPGRQDPPDIDVDFPWDERDAILDSVIREYGEERAARVANHVCFQPRSALRETARAFGLPDGEIGTVERALYLDRSRALAETDTVWSEILERALMITGFPRHLGVHSGGLVLVAGLLTDYVPVIPSGSGIRVTAWDKDGVEAAGLVKIDLLGNRSLAVVRDALINLESNGTPIKESDWDPLSDEGTEALLARGDTMGVFYVESPAMRLLQKKTGKGDFEHLVIHSSIIRPAANRYINEYIDRLKGKPYKPLHPLLDDQLSETYGILCYQEDVSKAAVTLAGFTPAEADEIRKVLSKKDVRIKLSAYRNRFMEGARARGVDDATIDAVWEMIESFAGYSFVKAHSASYAKLSFRAAYLRAHHPAEFMAAVLSNKGGFYSTLAYASEARRMGLRLLAPDVNESDIRCRGRGDTIRFGLGMISCLGSGAASAIVAERRRNGRYQSVSDLGRRVRIDCTDAEALAGSGALDSLDEGQSCPQKLLSLLSRASTREETRSRGTELFAESIPGTGLGISRIHSGMSERMRLEAQLRYLGTTLEYHPLKLFPRALDRPRTLGKDLPGSTGRRILLAGWPISVKPVLTSTDEPMEFVSFEDETALYEAVLFPEVYRRYRALLCDGKPLWVGGWVQEDRGAFVLCVDTLEAIKCSVPIGRAPTLT